jgi:hypothetical protein
MKQERLLPALAALIWLSGGGYSGAQPFWVSMFSNIPQLEEAAKSVVAMISGHFSQVRADSVGRLVTDMNALSGMESALAERIASLPPSGSYSVPEEHLLTKGLNDDLDAIKTQFDVVRGDFKAIDPQWVETHALLDNDIGSFASDGQIYLCTVTCPAIYSGKQPAITISDPQNAHDVVERLRKDVARVREIAVEMQDASNRVGLK